MAAAALTACAYFPCESAMAAEGAAPNRPDFLLPEDGVYADIGAGVAAHPQSLGSRTNVVDAVPGLEVHQEYRLLSLPHNRVALT